MAKTASQIQAERKAIDDARNAIHERQMAEIEDKKTQSTDPAKKVAMIQEIVSEKSAPKTALDMQKKKENAAEQKKEPDVPEVPKEPDSQTKAEEAKKKLEEYLQSEERKQNAKERAEKLRKDQFARQLLFGAEAPMVAMEPDRQEEALRAEADYWQQQVNKEKEDAILQQDLKEIEGLSDADKAALDTYLIERDRNYYNLINPMTGNAFAGKYSSNVEALLSRLGQKRVDELAFSLSRKRNAETAEKVDAAAREQVDKGIWSAIGANAASVGAKLLGGYTGILETAKDLTLNHKIDPNNMGQMANIYAGAVQGKTAENIEQTVGKPASYLYQGGMALADIGARALAGGGSSAVGATLAATQSFSDTLRDATQKGASTGQALTLATVKSGIEAATEKLPLDELFKVAKGGAKPAAEVVKNILKQAGVEIFEEEASLIGTTLAEAAILREKSSYNQQVMEAIANGATPEQARQQAKWAIIEEAIDTAIVSGISGGASGTVAEIKAARYGDGSADTQTQEGEQQPHTVQQEQTPIQTEQPLQPGQFGELVPELNQPKALTDAQQRLSRGDSASNAMAQAVLNDSAAIQQLVKKTGIAVEGTRAEQRRAVKTALEQLYGSDTPKNGSPENVLTALNDYMQDIGETAGMPKANDGAADIQSIQQVDTYTPMQMGANNIQQQSTEGGQVKGTGAAERNFSGVAAYEGMLEDGNIQKSRPGAVRDVEMPKKDSDGRRVTEFAGNAVSAGVTPDPMADAIKSLVGDKKLSFDTRTNQQSLDNAAEAIKAQGDDTVISSLHTNAENKTIVDGDIEKGLILYAQYANNPDPEAQKTASQIILDMGTIANMSGRNLQLFSLMKRMTPEGQLMTVRKNIERSIADINKGRSSSKQITYMPGQGNLDTAKNIARKRNVVIDDALEQNFLNAKTDEQKKAALDDIYRNVATQIKPTLGEAWDAWRNLAMLGNIKTHERNFASTGAFKPYTTIKRTIGAALESVFVKQETRTKSMLGISKESRDLVAWAKGDARTEDVKKLLGGAGTTGDEARSTIQDYRKILPGPLDTVRKKNLELMEAEDFFFKRSEYALSLASFLKARGYSIKQVQDGLVPRGVLDAGRQYAIKEAQKATFNDRNKLSDTLSKLNQAADEKGGPVYHIISKGIVPFLKTPANVVARVAEYNPVSLGKTLLTAKSDIDSGRKSGAEVIDEISAGLTGSAAMVLGAALANGLIPGVELVGAIEDEDELREGAQEYSIRIGDKYYSVAWLAPAMIPLFIGANLHSKFSKMDDTVDGWDAVQAFAEATAGSLNPMLELSMLSSLSDIVDKVKYEETPGDMLMTGLLNAATSYFTQGIPTVFGQLEQAAETEKKSTYVNTDNKVERMVKTAFSGATKRLPGDAYQTTKLDEFGEPVKKDEHWAKRTFDAFINPFTTSERKADAITKEITRLNKAQTKNVTPPTAAKTISYTDKQGNAHKDVRLTEEQYQTLAQTQGETAKTILDSLISSKDYAAMTDAQKAEAIQTAYSYARKTAEIAAIGDNHTGYEDSWMMEMEHGKEADYIIRRVTKSGLTGATDALKTAWDRDYDQTGRSDDLKWAYDTFKALTPEAREEVAGQITGTTAKYIEAREKGISHEDFVSAAETISRWEGTASDGDNRPIDDREAIANAPGLSDSVKDEIMKIYMTDYDPDAQKPEYSELKYDYIRQVLKLSPQQYARTYRAALDSEKNNEDYKAIMKLGYDKEIAQQLAGIYNSTQAGKKAYMDWYNKHH